MRFMAGILITSGLVTLSAASARQEIAVAAMAAVLAGLWSLAIVLRWPKPIHAACLGLSALLCALSTFLEIPVLIAALAISATLYGWDLALMDLRTAPHPREAANSVARKYIFRCLSLAGLGFGAMVSARAVHCRIPFFAALAVSCVCLLLFSIVYRHARKQLGAAPAGKERADGSAVR